MYFNRDIKKAKKILMLSIFILLLLILMYFTVL
jgi:predicted nucleic acid-binding Zn ribbon protein